MANPITFFAPWPTRLLHLSGTIAQEQTPAAHKSSINDFRLRNELVQIVRHGGARLRYIG